MPGREISAFDRTRIVALQEAGHSNHEIHRMLQIPRSSIIRINQLYQETGTIETRQRSGRPRVLNDREDRYLVQYARRHRHDPAPALRNHIQRTIHRVLSTSTVRRRLHAANLRARRHLRVPTLTRRHRVARLQWARDHRDWLLQQWRWVIFTDETRIGLQSDDRRQRVWREPGRQQRLNFPREVAPYLGGTVMFWGGIMHNRRTPLIPIRENMTSRVYIDTIIMPIILPLRNELGVNFILMDDNARPHRARTVDRILEEGQVNRLPWTANSPDQNPIENLWDHLSRAVHRRINPPENQNDLIVAVLEEWNNIPQDMINHLIASMHRRVNLLVNRGGGHTDY